MTRPWQLLYLTTTTTSVPKYKHLLTSVDHVWPFVLFQKNCENIIYFLWYILSLYIFEVYLNYFYFFSIFLIKRMIKHDQQKSTNVYIMGRLKFMRNFDQTDKIVGAPNLDWTAATNEFWLRWKLTTSSHQFFYSPRLLRPCLVPTP